MILITFEQLNLFQTLVNRFVLVFLPEERERNQEERLACGPVFAKFDGVELKTLLTKRSEKQLFFFEKAFEPRLGGGQKYSKTSQSFPINRSAMRADL